MSELVRLADGGTFLVRAMRLSDAPVVAAGFRSLSPASRRSRFFSPAVELDGRLLDDLVTVDPGVRIVLLAFEPDGGLLAGGARAVRRPGDAAVADVAVTVGDRNQGRGLGTALLRSLRREARAQGIERLAGHVLADNVPAKAMLRRAGARFTFDEPGVLVFDLALTRRVAAAA